MDRFPSAAADEPESDRLLGSQANLPIERVIIGGGYTGSRVLATLGAGKAIGFRRSGATSTVNPAIARLDLDEEQSVPLSLPARYTLLYTVPPRGNEPGDRRLARLLALLQPLPERFVYLSTSGVYGDCGGRLVDESTPPNPQTSRAARRFAAEQQLQAWTQSHGVSLIVLRVPGIYGPGRLGLDGIRDAKPILIESDANPGNRIHVDDLATCCLAALCIDRPAGIYNIADGDNRSSSWFTRTVARLAGLPAPPQVTRLKAEQSFSAMRLSFVLESRRLDNRKMRAVLGVEPRYADAEVGIRASLAADGLLMRETVPGNRP